MRSGKGREERLPQSRQGRERRVGAWAGAGPNGKCVVHWTSRFPLSLWHVTQLTWDPETSVGWVDCREGREYRQYHAVG
jgi:hypothetical protein